MDVESQHNTVPVISLALQPHLTRRLWICHCCPPAVRSKGEIQVAHQSSRACCIRKYPTDWAPHFITSPVTRTGWVAAKQKPVGVVNLTLLTKTLQGGYLCLCTLGVQKSLIQCSFGKVV